MSEGPLHKRKGSWLGTFRAVSWGFLGVRRNADHQDDVAKINPLHLLAVGLVMGLVFVFSLILVVKWVVS